MPDRYTHEEFDEVLIDENIIASSEKSHLVHGRMDKGVRKYGRYHRDDDYWHTIEGIKDRLGKLDDLYDYDQRDLTDCLRIAAGHVALDEASGDFDKALRIMRRRRWDRIRYRHSW